MENVEVTTQEVAEAVVDDSASQGPTGLSLKLANFEGPLDLLLHLVKEAKIEIKDIFVSEVTNQFLLYMNQLSSVDVAKASEYMSIAATLIEIKSGALLPKFDVEDAAETPEDILIRQLEEYKMFKELSARLKEQENVKRLYKHADQSVGNVRLVAKDMSLEGLLDAFAGLLVRVDRETINKQPKQIERDQFNVADKILFIQDELHNKETITFFSLFDLQNVSVPEVVVTFSAMLELLKIQFIMIQQPEVFGDILIRRNPDFKDNILLMEEPSIFGDE